MNLSFRSKKMVGVIYETTMGFRILTASTRRGYCLRFDMPKLTQLRCITHEARHDQDIAL